MLARRPEDPLAPSWRASRPRPGPLIRQPQPPGANDRREAVADARPGAPFRRRGAGLRRPGRASCAGPARRCTCSFSPTARVASRRSTIAPRYSARRRREAEKVPRLLGCAGLEVLGIRDGALAAGRAEAAAAIRQRLLEQRPGLLLVPSPLEVSADHRAAFAALYDVLSSSLEVVEGVQSRADPALAPRPSWQMQCAGSRSGSTKSTIPAIRTGSSTSATAARRSRRRWRSTPPRRSAIPICGPELGLRQFRTHTLAPQVALVEGYRRLAATRLRGPGPRRAGRRGRRERAGDLRAACAGPKSRSSA